MILLISSWQKSSKCCFRSERDFLSPSNRIWLSVKLDDSSDSEEAERFWKDYIKKNISKMFCTEPEKMPQATCGFTLKEKCCSVCECWSSSVSLLWRSEISSSSCSRSPSARLTSVLSWSLISCVTSCCLFLIERMSSVKIFSLCSTAVWAECWEETEKK